MNETIVTISNVSKKYNKKEVVKNISLEVKKGEILALLGHNGAGKSTLIKMLTGLIQKSGSIKIFGQEIAPFKKEAKKFFSYLPEVMSLYPHFTAAETLHFFADLQKLPEKREDEVLEWAGLNDYKKDKVGSFSKGMMQRMGFAIALLPKAPLLILDEPTSGLDPYWTIQFKKMIRHFNREEGTTIIFSSHILSEVEDLADRIGILSNGEMVALGTIQQLKRRASDEIKIKVEFACPVNYEELSKKVAGSILAYKNSYMISCKREEKMNVLKVLQGYHQLTDFEVKEITLEDIYQQILQEKYKH